MTLSRVQTLRVSLREDLRQSIQGCHAGCEAQPCHPTFSRASCRKGSTNTANQHVSILPFDDEMAAIEYALEENISKEATFTREE